MSLVGLLFMWHPLSKMPLTLQYGGGQKKGKDMCVWGMEILRESSLAIPL